MPITSYLISALKILAYFVITSLANYIYPGSNFIAQGVLFIALWGTWFQTNKNNPFSQQYGKYFNWLGFVAIINGIAHFVL